MDGTAYHVLQNSRPYGTEAFPCRDLTDALTTLTDLAEAAETERQRDGIQRFFCVAPPPEAASPQPPTALLPLGDALILYVRGGAVQAAYSDIADLRVLLVDADETGILAPVARRLSVCPLARMDEAALQALRSCEEVAS